MAIDPRDSIEPGHKEWEEFRASYAAAFLLTWLLHEARDVLDDYADDLENRFMSGWDIQENLDIDRGQPKSEWDYPLPPRGGVLGPVYPDGIMWMEEGEARALYEQLFPHRESTGEFAEASVGLSVVALHAALETYARALDVHRRGRMPRAIERFLREAGSPLDAETMRWIRECHATRNVIVHNRGIVDDRYVRSTEDSGFQIGEYRKLSVSDLGSFAKAIWKTARLVRAATGPIGDG